MHPRWRSVSTATVDSVQHGCFVRAVKAQHELHMRMRAEVKREARYGNRVPTGWSQCAVSEEWNVCSRGWVHSRPWWPAMMTGHSCAFFSTSRRRQHTWTRGVRFVRRWPAVGTRATIQWGCVGCTVERHQGSSRLNSTVAGGSFNHQFLVDLVVKSSNNQN